MITKKPSGFNKKLLEWSDATVRPYPWRGERDPYRIWLSEIMLQQTRSAQAKPFYERFLRVFPDVHALANAPFGDLLKHWEGLGYYRRAEHLHKTAIIVSRKMDGQFPSSYKELLKLPGIGTYTGAAIAGFAFGEKVAVLDGNVARMFSRLSGYDQCIDTIDGKKVLQAIAQDWMGDTPPGRYNQAIMDFGAAQCVPGKPNCASCPFRRDCIAHQLGKERDWPVRKKKNPITERCLLFVALYKDKKTWLIRRTEKDIWRGLYTFPSIAVAPSKLTDKKNLLAEYNRHFPGIPLAEKAAFSPVHTQLLTHQRIRAKFMCTTIRSDAIIPPDWVMTNISEIHTFVLPRIMHAYLETGLFPKKQKEKV